MTLNMVDERNRIPKRIEDRYREQRGSKRVICRKLKRIDEKWKTPRTIAERYRTTMSSAER